MFTGGSHNSSKSIFYVSPKIFEHFFGNISDCRQYSLLKLRSVTEKSIKTFDFTDRRWKTTGEGRSKDIAGHSS